jgi:hypothetical protein
MSDLSGGELNANAHHEETGEHAGEFTRRTVLAGVAATTVAATVSAIDVPARAQGADPNLKQNLILFVLLSAALTGIAETKLAPGFGPFPPPQTPHDFTKVTPGDVQTFTPGSDPVDIKRDYFEWVNKRRPVAFASLLRITRDSLGAPDRAQAIIDKVQFGDDSKKTKPEVDAKYLARSIVLMWYLGGWYDPDQLQKSSKDPRAQLDFNVISPKAYTQGWALKVAQAHPMGFSQMQFGYWTRKPNSLPDFIG